MASCKCLKYHSRKNRRGNVFRNSNRARAILRPPGRQEASSGMRIAPWHHPASVAPIPARLKRPRKGRSDRRGFDETPLAAIYASASFQIHCRKSSIRDFVCSHKRPRSYFLAPKHATQHAKTCLPTFPLRAHLICPCDQSSRQMSDAHITPRPAPCHLQSPRPSLGSVSFSTCTTMPASPSPSPAIGWTGFP